MLIVGIVGQPSSGKDTLAEYLAEKGFVHISSGDVLRAEMKVLGLPTDRTGINAFVTERRKERGNGYIASEIIKSITQDTVVAGLRNTEEVEVFKNKFGSDFILIAVQAPLETRYKWATKRGRIGDDISFEQFKKEEDKERGGSGFHEVDKVISMADFMIINDGSKDELSAKIDLIIKKLRKNLMKK